MIEDGLECTIARASYHSIYSYINNPLTKTTKPTRDYCSFSLKAQSSNVKIFPSDQAQNVLAVMLALEADELMVGAAVTVAFAVLAGASELGASPLAPSP